MAGHSSPLPLIQRQVPKPHHISNTLRCRIQFVLRSFRSTLLRASRLVSFPAGTKMLQFPAFPFLSEQFRYPWFEACMRLARAYRSLPRPSSALEPSYPLNGLQNSLPDKSTNAKTECAITQSVQAPTFIGAKNTLHFDSDNSLSPFKKNFERLLQTNNKFCKHKKFYFILPFLTARAISKIVCLGMPII